MREKEIVLNLIKNNSTFIKQDNGSWRLELSINIKDPRLIAWLRRLFVEEKR